MPTRRSTPAPGKPKKPAPGKKQAAKRKPAATPSPPAAPTKVPKPSRRGPVASRPAKGKPGRGSGPAGAPGDPGSIPGVGAKKPKPKPKTPAPAAPATATTERLLRRPGAMDKARDAPLTLSEEAFITEYLRNGENGTAAWIFTHPGTAPGLAAHYAYRLVRKGHVSRRVAAERQRIATKHELTREQLLADFLAIARADPGELVQMRAVACSACWGSAPRTNQWTDPDPDCEACNGEGHAVPWIADTRRLSPEARALYAGIHQTKDGIKVLMHDKVAALVNAGKIIGAFKEDNEQKSKPVAEALRDFFGQIHGDRLPIAKAEPASSPGAAPGHPLVGAS